MANQERVNVAANIWSARVIPLILSGIAVYASYVIVGPLCVQYLLHKHHDKAATIPILVIYFVLLILVASTYIRLVYITVFDPPYVELGDRALLKKKRQSSKDRDQSKEDGIAGAEYDSGNNSGDNFAGANNDPDSPGLELFYTKDIFTCEMDGKPRWCSSCMNWKPDRSHHCRSSGRCIKKMDHFCPWVGGPVGENNFKFFIQFVGYTALYCLHLLIVMSIYVAKQHTRENESVNAQLAVILGLAIFFFLFTSGMTWTSIELALNNLTQIERLGAKTRLESLAILKPAPGVLHEISPALASQPQYFEITYPLDIGLPPSVNNWQSPERQPRAKSYVHARRSEWNQTDPMHQIVAGTSQESAVPADSSVVREIPPVPESVASTAFAVEHTKLGGSRLAAQLQDQPGMQQSTPNRERLSDRDLKANRTFAILKMLEPGDNPWDLGTRIANWETVMGISVWDWFLPVRRSPCCNHEDTESQFMIGPRVDLLRCKVGFLAPEDKPDRGRRLKSRRGGPDNEVARGNKKIEDRRPIETGRYQIGDSTEMRDLDVNTTTNTNP